MWFRKRTDGDFQDEIESHIRMESDRLIAEGMTASEARESARRAFGNIGVSRERFYEAQRWMWWDELRRNIRYGLRALAKHPSFTAAAALTIALGVGANTAVFSLMDAMLLRPLPVSDPASLVFVTAAGKRGAPAAPPYKLFSELREKSRSFEGMAAYATDELRIEIGGHPEAVNGQITSGSYFRLLGVKSSLGRVLDRSDDDGPVAVISDRYWHRRFAGDPAVIGKTLSWDGKTYTIVGITPPAFLGLRPGFAVDVTFPIEREMESLGGYDIVARLKPGVTRARAESETTAVLSAAVTALGLARNAIEDRLQRVELSSAGHGADTLRGRFRKPLYALLAIAGLVLLLATANIANLLLARGLARRREFAIRLATGAARMRLVRQLITETLLLFVCGAIPGIFLARTGVVLVARMFAEGRRSITIQADIDGRVLAFAFAATLAAGLLAAVFPALRVFRSDLDQAIREGQARNSDSRRYAALQRTLVASQVAISFVLLVAAITFAGTLMRLRDLDPGFRNDEVLTMSVELPEGYVEAGESASVWNRLEDAVRGVTGVKSASLATYTPLSQRDRWRPVAVHGYVPATPEDSLAHYDHVSDGYFETLGVPPIEGRLFTAQDTESAPKVAVINESAARKFFAGRDAVGQVVAFDRKEYRIVGVVRDMKHNSLREPAAPFVFLPLRQALNPEHRITLSVASLAPGGETALLGPVRRRVAEVDPGLMISEVISLRRQMDATLLTERLLSGLASVFGALAMLLAAVGLYGVLSYAVAQQRQLIGIRMALGATPSAAAGQVLRQSGLIVAAGMLCGLPFAAMAVRASDSLLWGVKAGDLEIYVAAVGVLVGVGLVSTWFPARTASSTEPAEALRYG